MLKVELQVNDEIFSAELPETWHELSIFQLNHILKLLKANFPSNYIEAEKLPSLKILILLSLTKWAEQSDIIQAWQMGLLEECGFDDNDAFAVFIEQIEYLSNKACAFIFTTETDEKGNKVISIAPDLLKCPQPTIELGLKKGTRIFYPPSCGSNSRSKTPIYDDVFENMTIYELGMSFTMYSNYQKTKDIDYLTRLVAIIYREHKPKTEANIAQNYKGDIRLPLLDYEATIDQRKQLFAHYVDRWILECIAFWFGCCQYHFAKLYPDIFGSSGDADGFGFAGVIMALSRSAHTSKNEIAMQNAHSTMIELMYEKDLAKRIEKAYQNAG